MEQEQALEEKQEPVYEQAEQEIAPQAPITGISIRTVALLLLVTLVFGLVSGCLLGSRAGSSAPVTRRLSRPNRPI
jgi:hypothetical protein